MVYYHPKVDYGNILLHYDFRASDCSRDIASFRVLARGDMERMRSRLPLTGKAHCWQWGMCKYLVLAQQACKRPTEVQSARSRSSTASVAQSTGAFAIHRSLMKLRARPSLPRVQPQSGRRCHISKACLVQHPHLKAPEIIPARTTPNPCSNFWELTEP